MTERTELSGPQLANEYNAVVQRLVGSAEAEKFKPVKKFRTLSEGVKRLEDINKALERASAKPRPAEVAKPKSNGHQKPAKQAFGTEVKIKLVVPDNPRREGTKGHGKYAEMVDWLKGHPGQTIDQLFSSTSYKRGDFKWDLEHKHIEEVK